MEEKQRNLTKRTTMKDPLLWTVPIGKESKMRSVQSFLLGKYEPKLTYEEFAIKLNARGSSFKY